ncbi:hypothetical protein TNCT_84811 [Trichonephila clavata]|uniref:Uncharacterized protein n=1 Tax=Trichonephila clavata TaxID=2740835 RepID=A0A8X6LEK7_TRICU|nr:hypothetical protein TNCT_84811 [Trichonephila clavata]
MTRFVGAHTDPIESRLSDSIICQKSKNPIHRYLHLLLGGRKTLPGSVLGPLPTRSASDVMKDSTPSKSFSTGYTPSSLKKINLTSHARSWGRKGDRTLYLPTEQLYCINFLSSNCR